jgi:hypothetical protein
MQITTTVRDYFTPARVAGIKGRRRRGRRRRKRQFWQRCG